MRATLMYGAGDVRVEDVREWDEPATKFPVARDCAPMTLGTGCFMLGL